MSRRTSITNVTRGLEDVTCTRFCQNMRKSEDGSEEDASVLTVL